VVFRFSVQYDIKICGLLLTTAATNRTSSLGGSARTVPSWVDHSSADGDDLGADIDAVERATEGVERLPMN
jgi:hypothetical protein